MFQRMTLEKLERSEMEWDPGPEVINFYSGILIWKEKLL